MRGDDQDKSAPPPPVTPGADKSFLGPEFVTWLFFYLESEGWMLELPEAFESRGLRPTTVAFAVGEKVTLKPVDAAGARVTLAGPDLDDSGELLEAVRRGAFIDTLEVQLAIDARVYKFTMRAADGGISSVKLPDLGPSRPEDAEAEGLMGLLDPVPGEGRGKGRGRGRGEGRGDGPSDEDESAPRRPRLTLDDLLALRMAALEEIEAIIDALFARFVTRRVARAWHTEDIHRMRTKVAAGLKARLADVS